MWKDALDEVRSAAREQLEAAWQLHVDRVGEQLARGWREHIERVVEDRFGELSARLGTGVEETLARERAAARRSATGEINHAARRLRQAEGGEWPRALVEEAAKYCARAALFRVEGDTLRLEPEGDVETPLAAAPAFAAAVETPDPVVAIFSASELSPAVAAHFGPAAGERVYLFPLAAGDRATAVLYAESGSDGVDANALEALSTLAAAMHERRPPPAGLVTIGAAPAMEPSWTNLPASEQELHRQAQRFARVRVAELRLYQSQQVKEGRAARDLYGSLGEEIRKAREEYRAGFLESAASMVDYFHVELVRTLANDDASLLGAEYPGPLA